DHRPRSPGISLQIDQDIDMILMDRLGGVAMREPADIHEAVKGASQPRTHRTAIVDAIAIGHNLETIAIVGLEQARHQLCGGVLMEVAREIAEPNATAGMRA